MAPLDWDHYWREAFDAEKERHPEFDPSEYYRSGRASKIHPNKEDPAWWAEKGPEFVSLWTAWREASGLKILEVPNSDGELIPAIELECWAETDYNPETHTYASVHRCFIDRVFVDADGKVYIVDLKSGSHTAAWPQQMAFNNLCLNYQYGVRADYAGFWKARSGGVEKWFDLSIFSDEWLWDQHRKAQKIRDQQLFLAQPNNLCTSACGVAKFCRAMGGDPSFFENRATLTQEEV